VTAFGLYVHWPFCQAKCPYCDFNSHVTANVDQARWARALSSEIRRARRETGPRRLTSIFFGGGTPSLMEGATVATIIEAAAQAWDFSDDIEVTLEANPTSTEGARFRDYRAAGVNRVSLGVQSLIDADLKRLGRLHSAEEALKAIATARAVFERVSFDLIYARQDQTVSDWRRELHDALALDPDHLSLYQLTIEPGTAFFDRLKRGGLKGLPDEDLGADLWEMTQDICEEAGLPAYEISNHARAGAASLHNLTYWRNEDWVGIGPGAHGRMTLAGGRYATESESLPGRWIALVETEGSGEAVRTLLDDGTIAEDSLMMGLRLTEGVPKERVKEVWDSDFDININTLVENGLLGLKDQRIALTAAGRPVLNAILRELIAG
jgi:oxygen-independent coproporphyrinogen-3 oxidase